MGDKNNISIGLYDFFYQEMNGIKIINVYDRLKSETKGIFHFFEKRPKMKFTKKGSLKGEFAKVKLDFRHQDKLDLYEWLKEHGITLMGIYDLNPNLEIKTQENASESVSAIQPKQVPDKHRLVLGGYLLIFTNTGVIEFRKQYDGSNNLISLLPVDQIVVIYKRNFIEFQYERTSEVLIGFPTENFTIKELAVFKTQLVLQLGLKVKFEEEEEQWN